MTGAWLDGPGEVRVTFTRPLAADFLAAQEFTVAHGTEIFKPASSLPIGGAYSRAARLELSGFDPDHNALNAGDYELRSAGFEPVALRLGWAVYGEDFYSPLEMGMSSEKGRSVLRVFAPYAVKVDALVYDFPGAQPYVHQLGPKAGGVWERKFPGPLEGKYYRLRTEQNGKIYEGLDPYARCVTGDGGKALVLKDGTPVYPGPSFDVSRQWFMRHLRDLTTDKFWREK